MFLFLEFHPVPGAQVGAFANIAAALLVVVFGFLFVTVSARIVGIVGSSASPVSGMTIATLMATSAIFLVKGWTAPAFGALAITIGGIVCIAASNAGDTAQDSQNRLPHRRNPLEAAARPHVRSRHLRLLHRLRRSTLMNTGLAESSSVFRSPSPSPSPPPITTPSSTASRPRAASPSTTSPYLVTQPPRNGARSRLAEPPSRLRFPMSPPPRAGTNSTAPAISCCLTPSAQPRSKTASTSTTPTPRQIEIQWIQGIGSEKGRRPAGPPYGHGH